MLRRKELTLQWNNPEYEALAVPASIVRQILLNLLLNACHAAESGGSIFLRVAIEDHRFVAMVGDTGSGLSVSARDVLLGRHDKAPIGLPGGGLGLWLVRRLVKEAGGTVSVDSEKPYSTTIRVSIPIASREALADV